MKNPVRNLVLEAVAKTIKGNSFVAINDYENQKGEVANYLIVAGYSNENAMQHDFNSLQENKDKVFYDLAKNFEFAIVKQAYTELYESLEKRLSSDEVKEKLRQQGDTTILRSDAQNDAFKHIAKGVKQNKETEQLHIFGLQVRKKVLVPIEYKTVNSATKTLCKEAIKKLCNFREAKIRTFIFDKATVKLQGIEIK
jgi:preprotein translocase subunit SecD